MSSENFTTCPRCGSVYYLKEGFPGIDFDACEECGYKFEHLVLTDRLRKLSEDMKSISEQMKKENGNPLFLTHAGELYGASEMVDDWVVNLEKKTP